jgi:hypothetical protein
MLYMEKKTRLGYLAGLQRDLAIAKAEHLHPAIIDELESRIEAHKQYKRDYHKRTYKSRCCDVPQAETLAIVNAAAGII